MKNISNTPQNYPNVLFDASYQIKELVDFFQDATIGQSKTQDLGFGFTLPLYYYLRMHKVQCHIRTGIFGKEKLLWIKLVDHPNLIITNSWNQEGEIYIGPLKNEVIISQGCQFNADFAFSPSISEIHNEYLEENFVTKVTFVEKLPFSPVSCSKI